MLLQVAPRAWHALPLGISEHNKLSVQWLSSADLLHEDATDNLKHSPSVRTEGAALAIVSLGLIPEPPGMGVGKGELPPHCE